MRSDVFMLLFDGLDHRIDALRAMCVEQDGAALASVELVDRAGTHHIVRFTTTFELPAVRGDSASCLYGLKSRVAW